MMRRGQGAAARACMSGLAARWLRLYPVLPLVRERLAGRG